MRDGRRRRTQEGRRARGPAAPLAYGAGGRRASCARHPVQPAPPLLGHPVLAGCGSGDAVKRDQLIVATTTSLKDSGLIDDVVLPLFAKAAPNVTVKVLAVGSGEAMAMGEKGEADVLFVHSPADEAAFMAAGHGTLRLPVATNHFVIVGPAGDPAGVKRATSAAEAFA